MIRIRRNTGGHIVSCLLGSGGKSKGFYRRCDFPRTMTLETDLKQLLKARARMEQRLKDIDQKIDHLIQVLNEDRRCIYRHCVLDTKEDDRPQE